MNPDSSIKKTSKFIRSSATLKILGIAILVLLLLIPTSMIKSLIKERESRRAGVVTEINQKWGESQTITGPFITVPYKSFYQDKDTREKFSIKYIHILPDTLKVTGKLEPEIRYRSIYEAVLYNAKLDLEGSFVLPSAQELNLDGNNILWDKAVFSIGITDMRGIRKNINIEYNKDQFRAEPGLKTPDLAGAGVGIGINLSDPTQTNDFSFSLDLNGSERIAFIPLAKTTSVNLTSSWPSPSFDGTFLPVQRKITKKGFSADWEILHLNRNYPQYWKGNQYKVTSSGFGLELCITADIYQKITRVAKYAAMFIILTFTAFFFTEIVVGRKIHPIQYLLVGFAILIFYSLVLSLSEYISFDLAYILSALAITALITGYCKGIMKNLRFSLIIMGILILLYAYLYIVLQLEDYALLLGSIGLLLILGAIMFITRKIDWYSNRPEAINPQTNPVSEEQ